MQNSTRTNQNPFNTLSVLMIYPVFVVLIFPTIFLWTALPYYPRLVEKLQLGIFLFSTSFIAGVVVASISSAWILRLLFRKESSYRLITQLLHGSIAALSGTTFYISQIFHTMFPLVEITVLLQFVTAGFTLAECLITIGLLAVTLLILRHLNKKIVWTLDTRASKITGKTQLTLVP